VDKFAVITGASSGIGLAAAERFLEAGFQVANVSRSRCPNDRVMSVGVDLCGPGWQEVVASQLCAKISPGSRVILVHNAAASWHDRVTDAEPERLRAMLELNIVAPQALNRLFLPLMGPGSAIIYIGSTLSIKAVPGALSYVTAKHAMVGMMRATCQDLYGRSIHTACICPGVTDTPMARSLYSEQILDKLAQMTGVQRLIEPREVGEAIYLAATTPIVNGAVITADYGQLER
jgi:3-oxoacyl-[acyl-carrier protein] reductase